MNHLVFFDDTCGLCQNAVNWILHHDKKEQFLFAPLSGKTAEKLHIHFDKSTMVLIEYPEKRRWLRGKAAFRILWLLGGKWKGIGWLYMIPFIDLVYRLVASYRSWFFKKMSPHAFEAFKERFLP